MELFEALLAQEQVSIERFVRFRIDSPADAEDILQETYLAAYQKFSQLRNPDAFKAWVLSIARNKCTDYFRQKALRQETSFEALAESADSRYGASDSASVRETFDTLREKDRQILHFFFWEELTQEEIAKKLGIPIGTVKSRLFTAKQNFKKQYPYIFTAKEGAASMKKFPDFLPEYTIAASAEPSFALRWEELAGWFLIPRLGEKCSWGMYDIPSRKCSNLYHLQVTGKARVHGIEGVELTAEEDSRFGKQDSIRRSFVAQVVFVNLVNMQSGAGLVFAVPDVFQVVAQGGSHHALGTCYQNVHCITSECTAVQSGTSAPSGTAALLQTVTLLPMRAQRPTAAPVRTTELV